MRRWLLCNVFRKHLWVRFDPVSGNGVHACWYCGREALLDSLDSLL